MKFNKKMLLIIMLLLIGYSRTFAYDNIYTHPAITQKAIDIIKINLNKFIIDFLGIQNGLNDKINNKFIYEILQKGSTDEDKPLVRALNHFYNPLNGNGLEDILLGLPNLDWAMGYPDASGNNYSLAKTYDNYYSALMSENSDDAWYTMFISLGHVLHLLEDMGVPAHTRNDFYGHLSWAEGSFANLYEYWVKMNLDCVTDYSAGATPISFSKSQSYWDQDQYKGTNPDVTMAFDTGLAEYSNANFFSKGTIFADLSDKSDIHYFPYPARTSINSNPFPVKVTAKDGKIEYVPMLSKDKDGQKIKNFVAFKYFARDIDKLDNRSFVDLEFDLIDPNHEEYANYLILKTVSYTAGLINYFFRGKMAIVPKFSEYDADNNIFKKITVDTTNDSKWINDQIEPMPYGTIDLVIRYKASPDDNEYCYINKKYNDGMADNYFSELNKASFEFYVDMPATVSDVRAFLIYHGDLGEEEDSVAVGSAEVNFNGNIDIDYRLGAVDGTNFNSITILAKNTIGGEAGSEEIGNGKADVIIRYRETPISEYRYIKASVKVESISRDDYTPILFNILSDPLPVTASDISITMIYTGKIDEQSNTICISSKDVISEIDIRVPDEGIYAYCVTTPQNPSVYGFDHISLVARNSTSEKMAGGSIQLVVLYRVSLNDPFKKGLPPETSNVYYSIYDEQKNITSITNESDEYTQLDFDLKNHPIPIWATDIYFRLIFKGQSGTTFLGLKDVYEPTTIDILNSSDYVILHGTLCDLNTGDGLSMAFNICDTNKNGVLDDDEIHYYDGIWYFLDRENFSVRFSSIFGEAQWGTSNEGEYTYFIPMIRHGHYKRSYILSDEQFYFSTPDFSNPYLYGIIWIACSQKNQIELADMQTCMENNLSYPCTMRWFSDWSWDSNNFRGFNTRGEFYIYNRYRDEELSNINNDIDLGKKTIKDWWYAFNKYAVNMDPILDEDSIQ